MRVGSKQIWMNLSTRILKGTGIPSREDRQAYGRWLDETLGAHCDAVEAQQREDDRLLLNRALRANRNADPSVNDARRAAVAVLSDPEVFSRYQAELRKQ